MSMTITVGVFGPEYWSYMAQVMACQLDKAIKAKRIEPDSFPRGVYYEAKKFFSLVHGALEYGKNIPSPPASINAYAIASEAVKEVSPASHLSLEQLNEELKDYADFVDSLTESRALDSESEKIAEMLRDFFYQLAEEGDNEVYRTRADFEEDSIGLFGWTR
jgi:hypothetical protein